MTANKEGVERNGRQTARLEVSNSWALAVEALASYIAEVLG